MIYLPLKQYEFDGGIYIPRTKGSKNKPKVVSDFVSRIAEKRSTIESLYTEIASTTANIDSLKADLKAKRATLKSVEKGKRSIITHQGQKNKHLGQEVQKIR